MASGQPQTVVLLHSSASSPRQWQDLVEQLRNEYRVVAVEFHGHGMRPDWPGDRPMALADDAALAAPMLEAQGPVHLVGHSYGAAAALKVASLYPGRIASVVAYEPVLFRLLFDEPRWHREAQDVLIVAHSMREELEAARPERAARLFVEFWSGAGAWQALPPVRQQAVALRMPSVLRHFDVLFAEPFAREQLARFAAPMLFLSGAKTVPAARRVAQSLRVMLPLAGHEELPEMGHMGPVTHPWQVNARIRQFLHAHTMRQAETTST
jgi:pimeloyl-ACP methyl ester carboxylesterase